MAKLILTPEHQIQRLNVIINRVEELQKLSLESLTTAPNYKAWSILEVLEHLHIAYSLYQAKIENVLASVSKTGVVSWKFKARPWQRFVIEGQRPKGKKRPFKMKTLRRFEPLLSRKGLSKEEVDRVFERFFDSYTKLRTSIVESRGKSMGHKTISSAIGSLVRFYLPEAFEFLVCHAERHIVQIDEILSSQR